MPGDAEKDEAAPRRVDDGEKRREHVEKRIDWFSHHGNAGRKPHARLAAASEFTVPPSVRLSGTRICAGRPAGDDASSRAGLIRALAFRTAWRLSIAVFR